MNIIAIIQARMGSKRLPGKVMREINGKPLIGYLLDRLACCQELDGLVVAIPLADVNSTLSQYLYRRGVAIVAGDEEDVAQRFMSVLRKYNPDAFIRVCADSPLLDYEIVDAMAKHLRESNADILSSVSAMTPHGQYVEAIRTDYYKRCFPQFTPEHRQHAGFPYFYESIPRLCVDTEEDFTRVSRVIEQMTGDHTAYGVRDCLNLCVSH